MNQQSYFDEYIDYMMGSYEAQDRHQEANILGQLKDKLAPSKGELFKFFIWFFKEGFKLYHEYFKMFPYFESASDVKSKFVKKRYSWLLFDEESQNWQEFTVGCDLVALFSVEYQKTVKILDEIWTETAAKDLFVKIFSQHFKYFIEHLKFVELEKSDIPPQIVENCKHIYFQLLDKLYLETKQKCDDFGVQLTIFEYPKENEYYDRNNPNMAFKFTGGSDFKPKKLYEILSMGNYINPNETTYDIFALAFNGRSIGNGKKIIWLTYRSAYGPFTLISFLIKELEKYGLIAPVVKSARDKYKIVNSRIMGLFSDRNRETIKIPGESAQHQNSNRKLTPEQQLLETRLLRLA